MSDSAVVQQLVEGLDLSSIKDVIALFVYEGFNPQMVLAHLARIKKDKAIDGTTFASEIGTLLAVGCVMGNYNGHNKTKISEAGRKKADELFKKYEITEGGASNNRKCVNIPRLMATFPIPATKILMQAPAKEYGGAFHCSSLPQVMKNPLFPSLVPKSLDNAVKGYLLLVSNCYTAEQTMALRKITDPVEAYENQKPYTRISHDSIVPSDSERREFLKGFSFKVEDLKRVSDKYAELAKTPISVPSAADFIKAGFLNTT